MALDIGESDALPLEAVPLLLQIIGQPDHEQRDEMLGVLCDLVSSCYDEDGDAVGQIIRESGGLLTLSWLLAEPDANIVKQALFLIANLASDAVDPRAYLSKHLLRQCGCEYRLLPGLDSEDPEVVAYTCGALQNLCNDPEWSQVLLDQGVVMRLEVRAAAAAAYRRVLCLSAPPRSAFAPSLTAHGPRARPRLIVAHPARPRLVAAALRLVAASVLLTEYSVARDPRRSWSTTATI